MPNCGVEAVPRAPVCEFAGGRCAVPRRSLAESVRTVFRSANPARQCGSTTCDRTLPACAPGISEQGERGWGTLLHRVGICPYERRRVTAIAIGGTFTHEMFMRGFLHNLYLRPSCHECPARRLAAGSDLTIADYWGVEEHHPEMNDNKGTSLVIPLSDRGRGRLPLFRCR